MPVRLASWVLIAVWSQFGCCMFGDNYSEPGPSTQPSNQCY